MKEININTWKRKTTFEYFNSFANPCYGFDVEMDISELLKITKERKESFFINFLYIVTLGMNEIEELRTRIIDNKVIVFDIINPTYTILLDDESFDNGKHVMSNDYSVFYDRCKKELEKHKNHEIDPMESYNSNNYDEYYMTCIPWISYKSMSHPLPDNNPTNSSVPRVCWNKYYESNGKMKVLLNITVSHALVDGYHLSKAFINIQNKLDNAKELLAR